MHIVLNMTLLGLLLVLSQSIVAVPFSEAVASYDMEAIGSGGNLLDLTGNGHNATNGLGGANLVTSDFGSALQFTASAPIPVSVGDAPELRMSGAPFTIEARFRVDGSPVNNGGSRNIDWVRVVGKGNDPDNRNYGLWYNENDGWLFQVDPPGGHISAFASSSELPVQRNQWYHIAGVYDGVALKLYVDGQHVGTDVAIAPSQFPVDSSPFTIGGSPTEHSRHVGLIDDVAIFDRAFTEQQVFQNSQVSGGANPVPEPNSLFLLLVTGLLVFIYQIKLEKHG